MVKQCGDPMIERTFDAARLNSIANHEAIRPFIGGDITVDIDLSNAVADHANIFLAGEHGAFAFSWTGPGVYEVHTMVLPDGRGPWAAAFALSARSWMADNGANHLWTRVDPEAHNVRAFTLKAGFQSAGRHTIDLGAGPVTYDIFDWRAPCQQHSLAA